MSAPHYLGVWDTLWYYLVLPCTSSDSYSLAEAFYPDKPPTVFTLTFPVTVSHIEDTNAQPRIRSWAFGNTLIR